MGRKILAVVVALIVAFGIIMIVDMLSSTVFLPPSAPVMNDPAAMRSYMAGMPASAYVIMLIGYILAAFGGGFIVTKMSRRESPGLTLPVVVGVVLTLAAASNVILLPGQPIWFVIASIVVFIPFALLAHRFAR